LCTPAAEADFVEEREAVEIAGETEPSALQPTGTCDGGKTTFHLRLPIRWVDWQSVDEDLIARVDDLVAIQLDVCREVFELV
jgi:hypothetical protein